jgi:NAD(P)-dependent dehydrogenase (short-subunit alcohol dehydrogenase family)
MKTALITGSSRGIGKALALRLSEDGFKVIIHASAESAAAKEVKMLIEQKGGKAEIFACDLTDINETKKLSEKTGPVDVLVLNASVQYRNTWQNITLEECKNQLNCNFVSSLLLIQGYAENMIKKGWGRIITIGSVQEAKPHPDMLVYSATKAAATNMVKSLSQQLAPFGITVNNVAPGVINTDRNKDALSDPEYAKKVTASIPAGFYGEPEDCAGLVSLLCSDEARYITGQNIFIDGGKGL